MADKKDYNTGNTTQADDKSGIFGNNSVMGSPNDYDTWDWKQIEAVIVGASNLADGQEEDRAGGVATPQSLYDAGNAFQFVQDVLQVVSENLVAQAKALAGTTDAPWQGAAADSFMTMMETFSKQVAASANALSGGSMGASVPQTLVDAGNNLAVAQANIVVIDHWYAQQALDQGIKAMSNGLIPVSQNKEIVRMMTEDMRQVLHTLARQYSVETRNLNQVSTTNITSPLGNTIGDNKQPNITDYKPQQNQVPEPINRYGGQSVFGSDLNRRGTQQNIPLQTYQIQRNPNINGGGGQPNRNTGSWNGGNTGNNSRDTQVRKLPPNTLDNTGGNTLPNRNSVNLSTGGGNTGNNTLNPDTQVRKIPPNQLNTTTGGGTLPNRNSVNLSTGGRNTGNTSLNPDTQVRRLPPNQLNNTGGNTLPNNKTVNLSTGSGNTGNNTLNPDTQVRKIPPNQLNTTTGGGTL
ncbi:hypothetical protein ACFU95_12605, partial [Streptomyces sp. NPDC057623]